MSESNWEQLIGWFFATIVIIVLVNGCNKYTEIKLSKPVANKIQQ